MTKEKNQMVIEGEKYISDEVVVPYQGRLFRGAWIAPDADGVIQMNINRMADIVHNKRRIWEKKIAEKDIELDEFVFEFSTFEKVKDLFEKFKIKGKRFKQERGIRDKNGKMYGKPLTYKMVAELFMVFQDQVDEAWERSDEMADLIKEAEANESVDTLKSLHLKMMEDIGDE
jgi:hypothetical protein